MKEAAMLLAAALVAGCAGATDALDSRREDREYRRESERIEALEAYEGLRRYCARYGGTVFIRRDSSGRLAPTPTAREMKSASCSPSSMFPG